MLEAPSQREKGRWRSRVEACRKKKERQDEKVLTHQYRQISQGHLCRTAWTCRTAWLPQHQGCAEAESEHGWRGGLSARSQRKEEIMIPLQNKHSSKHVEFNRFVCYFGDLCSKTKMHTSLHTSIVPNTTCKPSKKLSPMMMTVAPPVVHPSLGLIALMHGVAAYPRQREEQIQHLCFNTWTHVSVHSLRPTTASPLCSALSVCLSHKDILWKLPQKKKEKKWWICPLRHENQNHLSAQWSGVVKQTLQMVHFTKAKR